MVVTFRRALCRRFSAARTLKPWTSEEDESLVAAVDVFGAKWVWVAQAVPDRRPQQCRLRWNQLNTSTTISHSNGSILYSVASANQGRFSKEEKMRLETAVSMYGTQNWSAVAQYVQSRTSQQCKHVWEYTLNVFKAYGPWSAEEDLALCTAVDAVGLRWARVSEYMRHHPLFRQLWKQHEYRSGIQCRQRVKSLVGFHEHSVVAVSAMGLASQRRNDAKWTDEEDDRFKTLLQQQDRYAVLNWTLIARQWFPTRTKSQCRIRFAYLKYAARHQREDDTDMAEEEQDVALDEQLFAAMTRDVGQHSTNQR